ncbi:speckle-type POZ protein-like [Onychomys torridus]|uniref:speckle-type POZ protein-like n=1 Tax=Onychomys torridus TaxID=38674 RepID=UPI00167F6E1F|nr:speckle-type POZ protein-like [Onychomys torridus]
MLDYIYTGTEPDLHSMAAALLAAADKYDLELLKVMYDKVSLLCNVSIVQDSFRIPDQSRKPGIQVHRCTLADVREQLCENSHFTDCCLEVAGQELQAHKSILATHSPVFRAIFEHDMEESRNNLTEIPELEPQVFKTIIYTGTAAALHSMTDAVVAAGVKYGLECLMVMCDDALFRDVSVENAAHTFLLGDLHSSRQLKTQTLDCITTHGSEVSETSNWKTMVGSYPHLGPEACLSLASAYFPYLEPSFKCLKQS